MEYKNKFDLAYAIVKAIPRGSVAGYSDIARLMGNPRLSRVVGYAMRACTDPSVPCHRVVYKDGTLAGAFGALGSEHQRALLTSEGVSFLIDGRVDMEKHRIK